MSFSLGSSDHIPSDNFNQPKFTTSTVHCYDIRLAGLYGVEEAVLIHHFLYWVKYNARMKKNFKDGRTWTYQSRVEIQAHFPYLNYDRIKYLCEKLVRLGVLVTAKHNKAHFDKTLWYAFADEQAFGVYEGVSNKVYEGQKCPSKGKSAQPIPHTKTSHPVSIHKEERIDRSTFAAQSEEEKQLIEIVVSQKIPITKSRSKSEEPTNIRISVFNSWMKSYGVKAVGYQCGQICKAFKKNPFLREKIPNLEKYIQGILIKNYT